MKPDKIDALVAEHVMGWKLSHKGKTWSLAKESTLYKEGWGHQCFVRNWRPSTNPMSNQIMRNKMRLDGWLHSSEDLPDGGGIKSTFHRKGSRKSFSGIALVEMLSDSIAALLTCGVEVKLRP